ncbi:MAG: RNA polymerase sigma factor [Saprospiraceae bacterium]|nr:RNA polymerase sigma factor [Saprospiraceae bacterium]
MNSEQEKVWIEKSKKGDLRAYGMLVQQYQDMVFNLCLRLLNNQHDAEDLSQEILIKLFKVIHKYEAKAPFAVWIYRVAYNEGLNKIRSIKRKGHTVSIEENDNHDWIQTKNVLESMTLKEQKNKILAVINALKKDDRFIVMAYYYDDVPLKEIASIMSLSESNVKIKLHRLRKLLATKLNHKILNDIVQ